MLTRQSHDRATRGLRKDLQGGPGTMEFMENRRRYATEKEASLLLKLVKENKVIVLDKRTDRPMIDKKNEVWDKITKLYNASAGCGIGATKSCQQLKRMWEHQKSKAKKKHSAERDYMRTSDGAPARDHNGALNPQIMSLTKKELVSLDNIYDSDALKRTSTVRATLSGVNEFGILPSPKEEDLETSDMLPAYSTPAAECSTATSMELKLKEYKLDMKIKEKEILCYSIELELKALSKEILQLSLENTKLKHEAALKKEEYYANKACVLSIWAETGQVWKDAGLAVKKAANVVSEHVKRMNI